MCVSPFLIYRIRGFLWIKQYGFMIQHIPGSIFYRQYYEKPTFISSNSGHVRSLWFNIHIRHLVGLWCLKFFTWLKLLDGSEQYVTYSNPVQIWNGYLWEYWSPPMVFNIYYSSMMFIICLRSFLMSCLLTTLIYLW